MNWEFTKCVRHILKKANLFFNVFSNKIYRASKKVQKKFTYNNIYSMFIPLEIALQNRSHTGYCKYNQSSLFWNPCLLLYRYTQLKRRKSSNLNNISIENMTGNVIFSLCLRN